MHQVIIVETSETSGSTHAKLVVVCAQVIFNAAAIGSKFTTADQCLRQSGIRAPEIPIATIAVTFTPRNAT